MKRSLLLFVLLVSIFSAKASDTLTVRQVYNFNVGDTFDYVQYEFNECVNYSSTSGGRKIVIAKSYSLSQDTIYYQYNWSGDQFSYNPFYNTSSFDTITNLDSYAIYLVEEFSSPGNPEGCSVSYVDTTFYFGYESDSVKTTCFESGDFFRYTQRLGLTYYSQYGGGDPCGTNGNGYELIHFSNDSMNFTLNRLNGITDLSKSAKTYLYPDPVRKLLHIVNNDGNIKSSIFILTDLLGKELLSQSISQTETTLDISNLASGLYTWRLMSDNAIIKTGKIIKE